MLKNLSSAAVVIDALRVKSMLIHKCMYGIPSVINFFSFSTHLNNKGGIFLPKPVDNVICTGNKI